MYRRVLLVATCLIVATSAAASEIAHAARNGDKEAVRLLLAGKVDVNEPLG